MYTCPMHPEIQKEENGSWPKCGMALEPMGVPAFAKDKTEYICPMHPEVAQCYAGNCSKCGMALEPRTITVEEDNAELKDMAFRFWVSTIFAIPVFGLLLSQMIAAVAMSFSSVSVISNALRLRGAEL